MIPAARFLGPTNLGKVAVIVTLIPIFSDLIDFGGGTFVNLHTFSFK
jgi:O-antigen/teichoic acid export membrane protein